MPFTLPHFNCTFDSYRIDPATSLYVRVLTGAPCQWYVNPRFVTLVEPTGIGEEIILHFLRVPVGTDIQEGDIVNVEPGDNFWYQLVETERVHKNFPNEYLVGFATNVDSEALPFGPLFTEAGQELMTEAGGILTTET